MCVRILTQTLALGGRSLIATTRNRTQSDALGNLHMLGYVDGRK